MHPSKKLVEAWLRDNPGWHSSSEVCIGMGRYKYVGSAIRSRLSDLSKAGKLLKRVKHKSRPSRGKNDYIHYTGPVYEYRYVVDIDTLID